MVTAPAARSSRGALRKLLLRRQPLAYSRVLGTILIAALLHRRSRMCQRDFITHLSAAPTAREKITICAQAISAIHRRLAPVFLALCDAATADPDCAALWADIADRPATNLRRIGELRDDLSGNQVADMIWSLNEQTLGPVVRERH